MGLKGASHLPHPDEVNTTLFSQGCVLQHGARWGDVGPACVPRTGEGAEEPNLLDPARGSTRGDILSTSSKTEWCLLS